MFHYLLSVCPVLDTPHARSLRDSCGARRVGLLSDVKIVPNV